VLHIIIIIIFSLVLSFPGTWKFKEKTYLGVTGIGGRCRQNKWHCIAILQWLSPETGKAAARGSDVAAEIRLPMLRMKDWPSAEIGPKVSMAMGANR
jgi:hypothetical protein